MNRQIACVIVAAIGLVVVGCEAPRRRPPPPPAVRYPSQPLSLADVKMLAKSGLSDEVITARFTPRIRCII
jgi:hypothetical protein